MEPWFEWSWLIGIKPVHRNGWLLAAAFWIIEAPLMFAAGGYFNVAPVIQFAAGVAFVAVAVVAFAVTFWKLKDHRDQ